MNKTPSKKSLYTAITSTILVALCCFTPILVIVVASVGLSIFTPYLDFILFPALALCVFLSVYSYRKYKKDCKACDVSNLSNTK